MRKLIVSLFMIVASLCCAQNRLCRLHVVDDATGDALPCVHAVVNGSLLGVSNAEGDVEITVAEDDIIALSSVGYDTVRKKGHELGHVVRMRTKDILLDGASVLSDYAILKNVRSHLKVEQKGYRDLKRLYFDRVSIKSKEQIEMVEGVFSSKSAPYLHDLQLSSGKYYGLSGDGAMEESALQSTNLHKVFAITPMSHHAGNPKMIVPFDDRVSPEDILRKYAVKSEVCEEDGRLMHRMTFEGRNKDENCMLCGTAYIDASTFRIVRFEGFVAMALEVTKQNDAEHIYTQPCKIRMIVNYTGKRGLTEIEDAFYEITSEDVAVRSHLYAVSDSVDRNMYAVPLGGNMLDAIRFIRREDGLEKYRHVIKCTEGEDLLFKDSSTTVKPKIGGECERLLSYFRRAMHFSKVVPQEKVYLHLDNTSYFANESMWFKAYLKRMDTGKPSDLSKVLYVELLNPRGDVVQTTKWPIDSLGQAHGDMKLDTVLTSGFYEVRAYTRYMTNWGTYACFSRVVPIFKAPKKEGDYSDLTIEDIPYKTRVTNIREMHDELYTKARENGWFSAHMEKKVSAAFYPEGGHMVEGKRCRVALLVVDDGGIPYQASGSIEDEEGNEVATVNTDSLGRGLFSVMPTAGTLSLKIANKAGSVQTFALPKAEKEGCALFLNCVNDEIEACVQVSDSLCGALLGYVLMHDGNVYRCDTMCASPLVQIEMQRKDLPEGVNQLTVFDSDGRVWAERLFFIIPKKNDGQNISVDQKNRVLRPCGKVEMELSSRPNSNISFSAVDVSTMNNGSLMDFRRWMLLASEVRGYIHDIDYYFESDDKEHRWNADLLMLTQGWRRYDWQLMEGKSSFGHAQPVEDSLCVFGQLKQYRKWNGVAGVEMEVYLYNKSGESLCGTARTDSQGYYAFVLPPVDGEWVMQIYTRKQTKNLQMERKTYKVGIDRQISPTARFITPMEASLLDVPQIVKDGDDDAPAYDDDTLLVKRVDDSFVIKNVTVRKKRRYFTNDDYLYKNESFGKMYANIYYDIDRAIDDYIDKGESMPTLAEFLKQQLKANVVYGGDEVHVDINNRPVAVIDGNGDVAPDIRGAMIMPLHGIKSMYVVFNGEIPSFLKSAGADSTVLSMTYTDMNPIKPVLVYIYRHYSFTTESQKGLRRTYFQGFNKPSAFQMEDYSVIPPMADFRRTIYWNPNVRTDAEGKANVVFYNNSTCREMYVSAEGMSDDGTILVSDE